jgi:lysophospholipase L1-like esterase
VRVNAQFAPTSDDGAILAVGDSFVFGDQVSDDETWPSILENRLNRRVVNGGVSGYGTAQAVLRAEHLVKAEPYRLVILSILVNQDLARDRSVFHRFFEFYKPAVIRENGRPRQTTLEESRRIVNENFVCAHLRIPQLFFWSYVAKKVFSLLGCANDHPKAATDYEILEFAVERLATFPVSKAILLQYGEDSFREDSPSAIDESRVIRDIANRYGVPVIDSYYALKDQSFREIYKHGPGWGHHSKRGNEVIADLVARGINCPGLLPGWPLTGTETLTAGEMTRDFRRSC